MTEILSGIRVIKYLSHEALFHRSVTSSRSAELSATIKLWAGNILLFTIGTSTSILVAWATFAVHVLVLGKELEAANAFTAVNLLATVGGLLSYLPQQAMMLFKAQVSFRRVCEFLESGKVDDHEEVDDENSGSNVDEWEQEEERKPLLAKESIRNNSSATVSSTNTIQPSLVISAKTAPDDLPPQQVAYENASFTYQDPVLFSDTAASSSFTLSNLSITFPIGKLTLICGSIGK